MAKEKYGLTFHSKRQDKIVYRAYFPVYSTVPNSKHKFKYCIISLKLIKLLWKNSATSNQGEADTLDTMYLSFSRSMGGTELILKM